MLLADVPALLVLSEKGEAILVAANPDASRNSGSSKR